MLLSINTKNLFYFVIFVYALVVMVGYFIIFLQDSKYETYGFLNLLRQKNLQKVNIQKVFIWTGVGRSGSTFLGELFNNHRDVIYYYEPLQFVYKWNNWKDVFQEKNNLSLKFNKSMSVLNDLFQCHATARSNEFFGNTFTNKTKLHTKAFKSHPVCFNNTGILECKADLLAHACQKAYSHVVIKELRGRFFGGLSHFHEEITYKHSIKYIHLIRDPRAMFSSALNLGWFPNNDLKLRQIIEERCHSISRDIGYGMKYLRPTSSYMLVRYEDLCLKFQYTTKDLLRFANLPYYADYKTYLKNIENVQDTPTFKRGRYSIEGSIKVAVLLWRKTISMKLNNMVEEVCGDLMDVLGYEKVHYNLRKLRDTSVGLLSDIPTHSRRGF